MKVFLSFMALALAVLHSSGVYAQTNKKTTPLGKSGETASNTLFLDVHHLGAGKVNFKDVAGAHAKDLATQKKYGADFLKYWVDEKNGDIYCLVSAPNEDAIRKTHGEAHGLLPDEVFQVTPGEEAALKKGNSFYLDVHQLTPGSVTAKDVAGAHQKDLAVQGKYGVNLLNYWVDEKKGIVVCLAQAPDSSALINTHKEAHGLLPLKVVKVKPGK